MIIALTAVLASFVTSVMTRPFSWLWDRILPTKVKDPECLSRLLVLEQQSYEQKEKQDVLIPSLQAAGCYVKAADWYPALRGFDRVGRRLSWEELTSG